MSIGSDNTRPSFAVETTVSSYDQLNAFLISAIMMFGTLATILFLIWATSVFDFKRTVLVQPVPVSEDEGDTKPEGVADDEMEPGVEDFPEVETPQLAMALEAVSEAVSSIRANMEAVSGNAAQMGKGGGAGTRDGGGDGNGGGIPEYKRWVINYESSGINEYASQLTAFAIDIGVVKTNSNDIYRVTNVANSPQIINSSRAREDKSLRFMHQKKRMQRWDQVLCKRAGANIESAILCQFYPESTRAIIRLVEAQALQDAGRELSEVRQTVLKIEPDGSSFKFVVVELLYRL